MVTINQIPVEGLGRVWSIVAPLLAPAVEHSRGRYNMRAVFQGLASEKMALWVIYGTDRVVMAAFTTRIAAYPCKTLVAIDFLGGENMSEWLTELADRLDSFVIAHGYDGLEFYGRDGWTRPLKTVGWEKVMTGFQKDALNG